MAERSSCFTQSFRSVPVAFLAGPFSVWAAGAVFVILVVLSIVIKKSSMGMAMRACSDNLTASRLMGIDVNKIIVMAFVIGCGLAAAAGLMLAGEYKTIEPMMGFVPGLKAFCAAVLGGAGFALCLIFNTFIL